MTTEQEEAEVQAIAALELPVMFRDREIFVRYPKPEQILVWQRTVDRLTKSAPDTSWTGSELMAALDRCRKIVDSLLVNRADIDWMDSEFLEGTLEFRDLAPFIGQVVQAFADAANEAAPNRAAKRAAKKASPKKAARKAGR